jgi:AcrR family transcriptional regulator
VIRYGAAVPTRSRTLPTTPRRTQSERRAGTRLRLLEAAIECLVALGYARTTTTEVCARAGVSQGALFKHFATKAELVSAAAEHLFASLVAEYRAAFAARAGDPDRAAAAIDLLWSIFHQPRLAAAFELYLAARTDPELAARLSPVSARHGENLRREARDLFPDAARAHPDFEPLIDVVVGAMQGEAIAPALGDPARAERVRAYLTRLARTVLTAPPSREETAR